jgi:hypothetical protein
LVRILGAFNFFKVLKADHLLLENCNLGYNKITARTQVVGYAFAPADLSVQRQSAIMAPTKSSSAYYIPHPSAQVKLF